MQQSPWTAAAFLALQEQCEVYNCLNQVTVVRQDGNVKMTSLRQQMDTTSSCHNEEWQVVQHDTANYTKQLGDCFRRLADSEMDIGEPLLYYPFGGIDVVSALGLLPSVRCVVFAGSEDFGGNAQNISSDFEKLRSADSAYMRKGMGATLFDSHDDFETLHEDMRLRGVGAMALLRLLGPMRHDVHFVSFFDFDIMGDVDFKAPQLVGQDPCPHVIVGVQERGCSEKLMKLLIFVQHSTHIDNVAIDAFCSRLLPDVMLLKAAPDTLWIPPSESSFDNALEGSRSYQRCIKRSILPAARAECIIVTDSCQADSRTPPPIFSNHPDCVALRDVGSLDDGSEYDVFGYGEHMFVSRGNNLRHSLTARMHVQ